MGVVATGGTITYTDSDGLNPRADTPYTGGYKVHTYTTVGSSTLEVTTGGDVEYLVVAGGGAGGVGAYYAYNDIYSGGGGGAGGYRAGTLTIAVGSKTVTVGDGGDAWENGDNSVFDSITATGGGLGGAGMQGSSSYGLGAAGGSGGGGGGDYQAPAPAGGDADYLSPKQGYDGGAGDYGNVANNAHCVGGGGGGSSAVGTAAANHVPGTGGAGTSNSISGTAVTYATGGSSVLRSEGAGAAGASNKGDGGTAGGSTGSKAGGKGGSGIVIVRYASATVLAVSTQAATSVTGTTCTGNGTIVSVLQDHTVNRRGFCYKETSAGDPTTADSVVYDDAGGYTAGAYTKAITGLTAGTVYKVRAYATDDHSTEYGATVTMTTLGTVDTDPATNITWNSVMGNGDVTSIGASALTAKGIAYCLASHGTPDTSDDKVETTGSATGTYSLAITGLTKSTDYHLRAYATNTEGTFYGDVVDVTTLGRTEANVERMIEIDFMEYATDALAQAEYVSSQSASLQCFSEDTIKTQGDNALKVTAGTGGIALTATGATTTYTDADGLNPRSSPAYDAGYTVLTFTSSGHIDVTTGGNIECLIVGGGAGGGSGRSGEATPSGGGGGEVVQATYAIGTGETTITVGDHGTGGGNGNYNTDGTSGAASSVAAHSAAGGLYGNSWGYGGASGDGHAGMNRTSVYAGGGGGDGGDAYQSAYGGNGQFSGGPGTASTYSGVSTIYGKGGEGYDGVLAATVYGGGGDRGADGQPGIVILRYQTSSANQTLTRTLSGTEEICNLSYVDAVSFDMRASRTGSNIKITLHDTSADTEITPNIAVADTWQEVVWDLSAVANSAKDDIHQIIVIVLNTDSNNIAYLDNFKIVGSTTISGNNIFGWVT